MIRATAVAAILCLSATAVVWANLVPTGLGLIHVHAPSGGEPCDSFPIDSCDEMVQVSDLTGTLAFDVIIWSWGWYEDIVEWLIESYSGQRLTFEWPSDWQFISGEVCGSGDNRVSQVGNQATFSIAAMPGAPRSGSMFLVGRIVLNATSEGSLRCIDDTWNQVEWAAGRAGVECGTCIAHACERYRITRPVLDQRFLELTADESGAATGEFHVGSAGHDYEGGFVIEAADPWLVLDIAETGTRWSPAYDVTFHADASGLAVGTHDAWIEVIGPACYECVRVLFTVPTPVPAQRLTWGAIKARFRH
jgi:hypothetical protein